MLLRLPLWLWFLVGCGLIAGAQLRAISRENWNPTFLMHVGAEAIARGKIERELGNLALSGSLGHDGKYFYLIARSPWFWNADQETFDGVQDVGYRYARPLYPILSGLGGTLSPWGTLTGMIALQILAGGLYAIAMVGLARRNRLHSMVVVLGLCNPGGYMAALLLTSDLLALALVVAGVWAYQAQRSTLALALFMLAGLAKEYFLLTPLALALQLVLNRQWLAAVAYTIIPAIPMLLWKMGLWLTVGLGSGSGNFTWPGMGIIGAAETNWHDPTTPAMAVALVFFGLLAAVLGFSALPRWQCAFWGALGITASDLVWGDPADLLRVVCPLWWFTLWSAYPWSKSTPTPLDYR